jgi:hypothetical protein
MCPNWKAKQGSTFEDNKKYSNPVLDTKNLENKIESLQTTVLGIFGIQKDILATTQGVDIADRVIELEAENAELKTALSAQTGYSKAAELK